MDYEKSPLSQEDQCKLINFLMKNGAKSDDKDNERISKAFKHTHLFVDNPLFVNNLIKQRDKLHAQVKEAKEFKSDNDADTFKFKLF